MTWVLVRVVPGEEFTHTGLMAHSNDVFGAGTSPSNQEGSRPRSEKAIVTVAWVVFALWMGFWFLMSAMVQMASDGCYTDACSDAVGRFMVAAFASQVLIGIATTFFTVTRARSLGKRLTVLAIGALAAPAVWALLAELSGSATSNQPIP